MALMFGGALALAGCGFADSHSPAPDFMRIRAAEPPPPEAPPEVRRLVRENLDSLFSVASTPQHVLVSPPQHEVEGPGWTACVKAELTSVMGKPLGTQTYRIAINGGVITDRRRIEGDENNCASESFEPI
jgi:hypothetical protein